MRKQMLITSMRVFAHGNIDEMGENLYIIKSL